MKMSKLVMVLGLALIVGGAVYVQRTGAAEGAPALTTADYVEIQNLYAKYNHYVDNAKDEGRAYANLFTKDAVFHINLQTKRVVRGHDELAALAKGAGTPAPVVKAAHHAINVMIEPSPTGAKGAAYIFMVSSPTLGTTQTGLSGIYSDDLVKTPEGWRFKQRVLNIATPRTPPAPAKAD